MRRERQILFGLICGAVLSAYHSTRALGAEDRGVTMEVVGQGWIGGEYLVLAALRNPTAERLNVNLQPEIKVGDRTLRIPPDEKRSPILALPAGATWSAQINMGKLTITGLDLPPSRTAGMPAIVSAAFRPETGEKGTRFYLSPGGPEADLGAVPDLPLLTAPEVEASSSQGIDVTVRRVRRAFESLGGKELAIPGLQSVVRAVDAAFAERFEASMDAGFEISAGDVWVALAVTLHNRGGTSVEIPLSALVMVPRAEGENHAIYFPVGVGAVGAIRLGSPLTGSARVEPGASLEQVLLYRGAIWADDLRLEWTDLPVATRAQVEGLFARKPQRRAECAAALGGMKEGAALAVPYLAGLLSDEESATLGEPKVTATVSWHAANALGEIGPAATDALLAALGDTALEAGVRAQCALGLHRSTDPRAVAALLVAAHDPAEKIRAEAAHALLIIADPTAMETFIALARDQSLSVRAYAVQGLGSVHDPRAVEPAIQALADRDSNVRRLAANSLRALGTLAVEPLIATLANDNRALVEQAAQLLTAITGQEMGKSQKKWRKWWDGQKGQLPAH